MSSLDRDSMNYLADQAKRLDPDRHFVAMLSPKAKRGALMSLIAFSAEIGLIRASVSEPMIGQMKFAWWRDVLKRMAEGQPAPAGSPLCAGVDHLLAQTSVEAQDLLALIDAREAELLDEQMNSISALQNHLKTTAVPLTRAIATVLGEGPQPDLDQLAEFHGLVRMLVALSVEVERFTEATDTMDLLASGIETARGLNIDLKSHLSAIPAGYRSLITLYLVSVRRLRFLEIDPKNPAAKNVRPPVFASLFAVWLGRI